MNTYRVSAEETDTTGFLLFGDDRLSVSRSGRIERDDGPAVQILGANSAARIFNFGSLAVDTELASVISGSVSGDLGVRIYNAEGGRIEGAKGAITLSSTAGTTGTVRIDNDGVIDGGVGNAIAMRDLNATTIRIVNGIGGYITNSGGSDVVRPGNDASAAIKVENYGSIVAGTVAGATSGGDGVDLQSKDGGLAARIVNHLDALIEGGKHGVTGANGASILNEGEIIGRNGSGLNFDTEASDGDGAVFVTNYGTITGAYDGYGNGDGDGVDVDYLVNIRNYGTIQGVGADNIDDFADGVAAGGGIIRNGFGATIFGETNGILIDDGDRGGAYAETRIINDGYITGEQGYGVRLIGDFADALTNRGTITATERAAAAIDMGGGDDRLVNTGDISGDVLLGDGNDSMKVGNVDGTVFGGAGDDVIAGGRGDDVIDGGLGFDQMSGGRGADTFVFTSIEDSSADLARADVVEFRIGDILDLSAIDADSTRDGDQAFTLNTSGVPTGVAGDLVFTQVSAGLATIGGDVDGDGTLDFVIKLSGVDDPSVLAISL